MATLAQKTTIAQNADGTKPGALLPVSLDDPVDRAETADQLHDYDPLADYLRGVTNSVARHEESERTSRRRKTVKLRNYICGNYLGYVDDRGVWQDKSTTKGADALYYDPETATYIDVLVASIVKSKPVWKIVPSAKDKVDMREAAKVAQLVFDAALAQLAPAKKVQREVKLNLIAAGETYRYTYFNPQKPDAGFYKTNYEPKISEKQKYHGVCLDCRQTFDDDSLSMPGSQDENEPLSENQQEKSAAPPSLPDDHIPERTIAEGEPVSAGSTACPHCGSSQTSVFTRNSVVLNVKKGQKFFQVGDVEADFVDPLEMTVVGDVDDISSALAVQRKRKLFRCILEETYGAENVPEAAPSSDTGNNNDDYPRADGSRSGRDGYGDQMAQTTGETTSNSARDPFEQLPLSITWLAPAAYAAYQFPQNTKLKGGKFVPVGTKLIKLFPNGLCVSRIGDKIVNLYAQSIKECWSHSVNSVGEGFHGIGEWDLSALQDQLNNVSSMKMNSLMHDSTSPLIIRSKYVKGAQLKNKVGLVVPISEDFPDNRNLSEVATRLPNAVGVPEAYELANDLKDRMVSRTGAMTNDGGGIGSADASRNTATGYRLWYEHTLGRRAPMLTLRAEMIVEQGFQILEMKQKYLCEKMFEFAESEASGDAVKWFINCNIRRDLKIEIEPGSWMPQSEIQQKADFVEFMGIIAPLVVAKPELVDKLIERISENYAAFDLTEHASDTTEGQIRLEKLVEIAKFAETQSKERGLPTEIEEPAADGQTFNLVPNAVLIDLVMKQTARDLKVVHAKTQDGEGLPPDPFADFPLDVMFDDHKELEKTYTDYLKTATGRRQSIFVRACVQRAALLHRKANFELMRQMKQLELAAQEPDLQAGLIASDAQHKQQMQQNDELGQQQLQQNEAAGQQQLQQQGAQQLQSAAIQGLGHAVEADATDGDSAPQ